MKIMKISEHITYDEATLSPTAIRNGISNQPNDQELANMKLVAENCFEPLRKMWGKPIKVNSFFRSKFKSVGRWKSIKPTHQRTSNRHHYWYQNRK